VRGHALHGRVAPDLQEALVARGVELQDGGPELEALRPLRPAAARVFAADGEDGRSRAGFQRFSSRSIFAAESSKRRRIAGCRACAVREGSLFSTCL
jgi:hypothetical protein